MKKLDFKIDIKAPREKVWEVLWKDKTYREWTSVFSAGSHAESDWNEGSRVHFLDANKNGMFSVINEKKPAEYMSFKHLGVIKEGKEQPIDKETEAWAGSTENYSLKEIPGGTELIVDMDITLDFEDYFKNSFPKALDKIKQLAETD
jgi:hypothetical protein